MAAQQNNLPVLYSYCNSFFIRYILGEFGLLNVHFLDILPAILSRKVREKLGIFSVAAQLRSVQCLFAVPLVCDSALARTLGFCFF